MIDLYAPQVVVSLSPNGDFDGPEDGTMWGLDPGPVIARPAHSLMKFREYVSMAKHAQFENLTKYIEYFPLPALSSEELKDIFRMKFANALQPRLSLLWMGMYDSYQSK